MTDQHTLQTLLACLRKFGSAYIWQSPNSGGCFVIPPDQVKTQNHAGYIANIFSLDGWNGLISVTSDQMTFIQSGSPTSGKVICGTPGEFVEGKPTQDTSQEERNQQAIAHLASFRKRDGNGDVL